MSSYEDWEDKGKTYGGMGKSLLWWVGDWALIGKESYPEKFDQAVSDAGYEYGTVEDAMRVCRAFPVVDRHYGLSYYHHREVASMPTATERREWLGRALAGGWSIAQLRRAIRLDREQSVMLLGEVPRNDRASEQGADPDFHIVVANPPWRYINKRINWNLIVPPAIPVPDTGGCCFIRSNHRHIDQAMRILKKWGYTHRATYLVDREPSGHKIDSSSLEDWRWTIPSRDMVLQGSKGRWRPPPVEDRMPQIVGSWESFCVQIRKQNEWGRVLHMWPKDPLQFEDDERAWVWTGVEKEERERRKDAAAITEEISGGDAADMECPARI